MKVLARLTLLGGGGAASEASRCFCSRTSRVVVQEEAFHKLYEHFAKKTHDEHIYPLPGENSESWIMSRGSTSSWVFLAQSGPLA